MSPWPCRRLLLARAAPLACCCSHCGSPAWPRPTTRRLALAAVRVMMRSRRCALALFATLCRGVACFSLLHVPWLSHCISARPQAYRKLALRWHPDRVDASERAKASEKFKRITEAYSTLSDKAKRRQYDLLGDTPYGGASGGGYGYEPRGAPFGPDPFGFGGGFQGGGFQYGFQHRPPEPPPQALRRFDCSLAELDAGCKKTFTLKDSRLSRLRDAVDGGWTGPGARAAAHMLTVALSVVWRFPSFVIGRRWWLKLPVLAAAWVVTLCNQLPPSPAGVFEFEVRPGWREGTKVVFKSAVGRKVAFELRERRDPRFERQKHDLVYR